MRCHSADTFWRSQARTRATGPGSMEQLNMSMEAAWPQQARPRHGRMYRSAMDLERGGCIVLYCIVLKKPIRLRD